MDSDAPLGMIGSSSAMVELRQVIRKFAKSRLSVLITGPTGAGKELVARALHEVSGRGGPFVAVNCGAIPHELVERELFGHERGAFTGAERSAPGLFTTAERGTLFLDEVGELPLQAQKTLLRVLQEKAVRPVGGTRETRIDVRIVAATLQDLQAATRAGTFREDLYYRLAQAVIRAPSLGERAADIPLLAAHFLAKEQADGPPAGATRLSPGALARLAAHPWRGNVRELQSVVGRALAEAEGAPEIEEEHVGRALTPPAAPEPVEPPDRDPGLQFLLAIADPQVSLPDAFRVWYPDARLARIPAKFKGWWDDRGGAPLPAAAGPGVRRLLEEFGPRSHDATYRAGLTSLAAALRTAQGRRARIGWAAWGAPDDPPFEEAFLLRALDAGGPAALADVAAGKVPRFLLLGPMGSGKSTLSRWLAESLGAERIELRALGAPPSNPTGAALAERIGSAPRLVLDGLDECTWPLDAVLEHLRSRAGGIVVATSRPLRGLLSALPADWTTGTIAGLQPAESEELARRAWGEHAEDATSRLRRWEADGVDASLVATPLAVLLAGSAHGPAAGRAELFEAVLAHELQRAGLADEAERVERLAFATLETGRLDETRPRWLELARRARLGPDGARLVDTLLQRACLLVPSARPQHHRVANGALWQYLASRHLARAVEEVDLADWLCEPLTLGALELAVAAHDSPTPAALHLAEKLADAGLSPRTPPDAVAVLVDLLERTRVAVQMMDEVLAVLSVRYRAVMDLGLSGRVAGLLRPLPAPGPSSPPATRFRHRFIHAMGAYVRDEGQWREGVRTAEALAREGGVTEGERQANHLQYILSFEREDEVGRAIELYEAVEVGALPPQLAALYAQFRGVARWRAFAFEGAAEDFGRCVALARGVGTIEADAQAITITGRLVEALLEGGLPGAPEALSAVEAHYRQLADAQPRRQDITRYTYAAAMAAARAGETELALRLLGEADARLPNPPDLLHGRYDREAELFRLRVLAQLQPSRPDLRERLHRLDATFRSLGWWSFRIRVLEILAHLDGVDPPELDHCYAELLGRLGNRAELRASTLEHRARQRSMSQRQPLVDRPDVRRASP